METMPINKALVTIINDHFWSERDIIHRRVQSLQPCGGDCSDQGKLRLGRELIYCGYDQ